VEFVATDVTLGCLLQDVLRVYPVTIITPKLHTHRHNFHRTNGRSLGAFQKNASQNGEKIKKEKYFSGFSKLRPPY
jgi:hypothetical protein